VKWCRTALRVGAEKTAAAVTGGGESRGQAAGDLYQIAPQSQLTHENAGANLLLRDHAQGREEGHHNGKVEM